MEWKVWKLLCEGNMFCFVRVSRRDREYGQSLNPPISVPGFRLCAGERRGVPLPKPSQPDALAAVFRVFLLVHLELDFCPILSRFVGEQKTASHRKIFPQKKPPHATTSHAKLLPPKKVSHRIPFLYLHSFLSFRCRRDFLTAPILNYFSS